MADLGLADCKHSSSDEVGIADPIQQLGCSAPESVAVYSRSAWAPRYLLHPLDTEFSRTDWLASRTLLCPLTGASALWILRRQTKLPPSRSPVRPASSMAAATRSGLPPGEPSGPPCPAPAHCDDRRTRPSSSKPHCSRVDSRCPRVSRSRCRVWSSVSRLMPALPLHHPQHYPLQPVHALLPRGRRQALPARQPLLLLQQGQQCALQAVRLRLRSHGVPPALRTA